MQIPLQIAVRDMGHSAVLEGRIRDKVAGLGHFHPRITSCRVTAADSGKHHQQGRQFEVHVDVLVPGHAEIIANRKHDKDIYAALRDAFDSVKRQFEEAMRGQRGDVKAHGVPQQGP